MIPDYLKPEQLKAFISTALAEDIGRGDYSTIAAVPEAKTGSARLLIKDDGILAGVTLAQKIFQFYDPQLQISVNKIDGDRIMKGDIAFQVTGRIRSILTTERLILNCMQRMSGIATHTARLVRQLKGTNAQVLDTRKTTPNFRAMEKWAVAIGGGQNHRFALCDLVMLKDNHIDACGGITKAITQSRKYLAENGLNLQIEVETRNLEEVEEALNSQPDIILLDNMSADEMRQAVQLVNGKCKTEASGGITEKTIRSIAETGVDFISVGSLTHTIKSLDMSLKILKE